MCLSLKWLRRLSFKLPSHTSYTYMLLIAHKEWKQCRVALIRISIAGRITQMRERKSRRWMKILHKTDNEQYMYVCVLLITITIESNGKKMLVIEFQCCRLWWDSGLWCLCVCVSIRDWSFACVLYGRNVFLLIRFRCVATQTSLLSLVTCTFCVASLVRRVHMFVIWYDISDAHIACEAMR